MLPADQGHVGKALPQRLGETVLVTVHPEHVAPKRSCGRVVPAQRESAVLYANHVRSR